MIQYIWCCCRQSHTHLYRSSYHWVQGTDIWNVTPTPAVVHHFPWLMPSPLHPDTASPHQTSSDAELAGARQQSLRSSDVNSLCNLLEAKVKQLKAENEQLKADQAQQAQRLIQLESLEQEISKLRDENSKLRM